MHKVFDFSTEVVPLITEEMKLAQKYVRIAMFQIHNDNIFETLSNLLAKGVKVEIITLPYDSINEEFRTQVEKRFEDLRSEGAQIHLNRWNVGDPQPTKTAVGRWYSFHGKFIVTDKSAIALSANFTHGKELDSAIIFKDTQDKINEFNVKFEELRRLFITRDNNYDGEIRRRVLNYVAKNGEQLFKLPKTVEIRHKDHWVLHYPVELCPTNVPIEEKLYLTPFDCRGRDLIINLLENANEYAYLSTESFTDEEFSKFLVNLCVNKDIELKILTGTRTRDFTDRIQSMFRDLLTQKIEVKTTTSPLHAKLILTDKALVISSINLNNMNLGFYQTKKFWRENTETLLVCQDSKLISLAKEKYLQVFAEGVDIEDILCHKLEAQIRDVFVGAFQLSPNPEVRALFAKFILKKEIETKKTIIKLGKITKRLMVHFGKERVEKEDFIAALILYHLSEAKRDFNQLKEKIDELDENINLKDALNKLMFANWVEKEDEYYKINLNSLNF